MSNYFLTLQNDSKAGVKGYFNPFYFNSLNSNQYLQMKFNINYLSEMEKDDA